MKFTVLLVALLATVTEARTWSRADGCPKLEIQYDSSCGSANSMVVTMPANANNEYCKNTPSGSVRIECNSHEMKYMPYKTKNCRGSKIRKM